MTADIPCFYATLSIHSVEISAQDIADVLQVQIGKLREAGQPISLRTPDKLAEYSTWQLTSKNADGVDEAKSIHEHIEYLVGFMEQKRDAFKLLESKCDFDIWCFVSFQKSNHGFDLIHTLVRRLSAFPVSLRFDIYGADVG